MGESTPRHLGVSFRNRTPKGPGFLFGSPLRPTQKGHPRKKTLPFGLERLASVSPWLPPTCCHTNAACIGSPSSVAGADTPRWRGSRSCALAPKPGPLRVRTKRTRQMVSSELEEYVVHWLSTHLLTCLLVVGGTVFYSCLDYRKTKRKAFQRPPKFSDVAKWDCSLLVVVAVFLMGIARLT